MSVETRYSCQIKLPGFGSTAQARLRRAKVLIVGAGGLGCPAAQYLTSAGVGTLALADFDKVEPGNLHRQVLFGSKDVGKFKADAATAVLKRQRLDIDIEALPVRVTGDNVLSLMKPYDVVMDCTDNFETRYLLNDACVLADKPLVYGAAYQYQGQVAVWNVPNGDGARSPHYRDIFSSADMGLSVDCSSGGVMPTLTGIIGCMQANEVIKYLAGLPGLLTSRLLIFDARTMQSQIVKLPTKSKTAIKKLPAAVPIISSLELQAALTGKKYELVDVRTSEEHAVFNIGGRLLPLERLVRETESLDLNIPTVFYCTTGKRSAAAARLILDKYPTASVFSLEGGVTAWQRDLAPA